METDQLRLIPFFLLGHAANSLHELLSEASDHHLIGLLDVTAVLGTLLLQLFPFLLKQEFSSLLLLRFLVSCLFIHGRRRLGNSLLLLFLAYLGSVGLRRLLVIFKFASLREVVCGLVASRVLILSLRVGNLLLLLLLKLVLQLKFSIGIQSVEDLLLGLVSLDAGLHLWLALVGFLGNHILKFL